MHLRYIMTKEKKQILGWEIETMNEKINMVSLIDGLAISTMCCRLHFLKYDHVLALLYHLSQCYESMTTISCSTIDIGVMDWYSYNKRLSAVTKVGFTLNTV